MFSEVSMLKTSIPDQFKHILKSNSNHTPTAENNTNEICYDKQSSSFKKQNGDQIKDINNKQIRKIFQENKKPKCQERWNAYFNFQINWNQTW